MEHDDSSLDNLGVEAYNSCLNDEGSSDSTVRLMIKDNVGQEWASTIGRKRDSRVTGTPVGTCLEMCRRIEGQELLLGDRRPANKEQWDEQDERKKDASKDPIVVCRH